MAHEHHHHHTAQAQSLNGIFIFSILLNVLFVLIEAGVGFWQNSLSLLSDAGHNLSDVFSLLLVLVAFRLAKVHSNEHFTYGYRKSTVLISLLNAVILLVAVGAIVIESIHKFSEPAQVNGIAVSWTAGVGILINGFLSLIRMSDRRFSFLAVALIKGWFDEDRLQPWVLCDLSEMREGPVKKQLHGFRDNLREMQL